MVSWTWLGVATLAVMAVPSFADSASAHIYTMDDVASWQLQYEMTVQLSAPNADILDMSYTVVPLTTALGLNRSSIARESINIPGDLVLVTHTNYNNITGPSQIAYLCCDDLNNSFTDPDSMLETLMANLPKAILLYSQEGNCCGLRATSLSYQTLFTMAYSSDAAQALNFTSSGDGVIRATISGNTTSADNGQTGSNGTSNSAIAMSILYSITGLITALFLIIIATGAIRVHRYPDRYGPRSGHGGRTRQSRARGLARAVLETLPIVKFGDPAPAKPDLGTELESQPSSEPVVETANVAAASIVQVHHLSSIPEDAVPQPKSTANVTPVVAIDASAAAATARAGPEPNTADATAAGPGSTAQSDDDHLGCSICTEDFLVGEDVRVLPCNHKFHPTCVDPWLVNVSGTCPLCRMDLRPKDEQSDSRPSTAEMNLPPPLEDDETATAAVAAEFSASGQQRHRASRLFDLNRLRHASAEERIEALRRYRSETQSGSTSTVTSTTGGDEHSRSVTLTRRLRDKFHIRTHAQSSG